MFLGARLALLILCVISPLFAHTRGRNAFLEHLNDIHDDHHHHPEQRRDEEPCAVCSEPVDCCTPRIQCPTLGPPPPVCHVGRFVGVCCSPGLRRSDHHQRASLPNAEALRSAHHSSDLRLKEWLKVEERVTKAGCNGTVLERSSPSYGHFMSIRSRETAAKEDNVGRGALRNLFAAQNLKERRVISDEQLQLGINPIIDSPFCPPKPFCPPTPQRYRHIGGECNNVANPGWGAVHTAFERILPPNYGDGTWSFRLSVNGHPLTSPRAISETLLLDVDNPSTTRNLMLSQFGQFMVHDMSKGVTFTNGNGSAISCCSSDGTSFLPPELQHEGCAAIPVDPADGFFSQFQLTCMNFVRSQLAPNHDCSLGSAKQMNGVTQYPDLSTIYGSTEAKLAELRDVNGRMRIFFDFGRELPPLSSNPDDCLLQQDGAACFASGDDHINQMISLVSIHTLFIREHNRLAEALASLNPTWTEDVLFLEARRILIAEYQHIIYNEWLPLVIGEHTMEEFRLTPQPGGEYSTDYNQDINPSITSEFAAAAFRFGHSTVDNKLRVETPHRTTEEISIPEVMFQPSRMRLRQFHDRLLTGLSWQPMQKADPFVSEALTRYMFHGGQPFGLDLGSINIQRGRDHGLRSYNDYIALIGSKPVKHFQQFSPKAAQRLSAVYASPDDMDLWVGGLMEPPLDGAAVGNTFAHIIADQFSRLRRGDCYFYEHGPDVNPGAFTKEQLLEIKKVSMSRLICDHSDRLELHQHAPHAFLRPLVAGNTPVPCDSLAIPSMDLTKFKQP